jgi:hypothetical protein
MKAVDATLIVQEFELLLELRGRLVSFAQVRCEDLVLLHDSNPTNELAEVLPIDIGENTIEDRRSETEEVE